MLACPIRCIYALQTQRVRIPNFDVAAGTEVRPQLQPWLVPHSVQTPQAPARMTLSLPQTEQVMPMKMLPSATVTRSDEVPVPLPFPAGRRPTVSMIGRMTSDDVDHFLVACAREIGDRPIECFLLDVGNFFER